MRKLMTLVLALALVAAACGGDDATDPASIDSCDGVLDAGFDLLQSTITEFDQMSEEDLMAMGESEETPAAFQELEEQGEALAARSEALGCDPEELSAGLAGRIDDLEAESFFGQAIIASILEGDIPIFTE